MSGLSVLLDPSAVARSLHRAGLRPASAGPLILERGWAMPRIPLMLRFRDPAAQVEGGLPAWWSLHALPPGRPPFAYRRALKGGAASWLEELAAVVQRFPRDLMLDQLPGAATPIRAPRELLAGLPPEAAAGGGRLEARVLAYKPARRCLVRYRRPAADGGRETLLGKCFPEGVDVEQWQVHRDLDRTCRRRDLPHLSFARPRGRVPGWRMLWWRRQPGRPIYDLLGTSEGLAAVAWAGCCLAELHASGTPWRRVHGADRERETLAMWVRTAAESFPCQADRLAAAEKEVLGAAAAASEGPTVPSHRDFYDKQLLVHQGRTVLLDLETACRAEAELDVANFLAHLRLRGLQRPDLDTGEAASVFLDGYRRGFRTPDRGRLGWYEASALLRLACVYAFRPAWGTLSSALVREARRAIGETARLLA